MASLETPGTMKAGRGRSFRIFPSPRKKKDAEDKEGTADGATNGSDGGGEGEVERRGGGGGDFSGSPHPETTGGVGGGSGEQMTGAPTNQAPTGALVNSTPNGDATAATIVSTVSGPIKNRRSVTEPAKGGVGAGGGKSRSQPGQGAGTGSQPRFTSVPPSALAHPHHVDGAGGVRGGEVSTEVGTGRRNSTYSVYPVSVGRRPKKDGGDGVPHIEGAVGPCCVRQDRRRRRAGAGGSSSSSGSQARRQGGGGGGKGGIGSRVRRLLRIRNKGNGIATEYANVFLVLGLYDGGDLIQNGYVCLRAADISDGGVEGGGAGGTGASCNYSVQPDIVIIGVKVAITAPTLLEERRAVIYLRDYLANQLSVYPFLRHCILVTKKSKKRRKKTVFYTVLGSGQYTAIVNASTQVDGITPLEVCLLRRTGGPRFDPQSTRHRGSVLGSVVSTIRSSVRDLRFASE
ncbi:hypothetical protein CSUI_001540 [Cystoisospora suis]|uniref:Uncharacterized protein n=1 Tax=Cystoisospora suis TaxID=483139 RepID=A0A2C6LA52_9APIC|nr:hypothetical protein CSUI_001540 [Cystoisospora suis]